MGVYANGHLIYGFVHDDDTAELFRAIGGAGDEEENEEGVLEEMHQDLQEKYHISLYQVGYEGVDVLSAYSANASGKGFDVTAIKSEDMAKTEEYAANIRQFLEALGIDASKYRPGWYLLGYMD